MNGMPRAIGRIVAVRQTAVWWLPSGKRVAGMAANAINMQLNIRHAHREHAEKYSIPRPHAPVARSAAGDECGRALRGIGGAAIAAKAMGRDRYAAKSGRASDAGQRIAGSLFLLVKSGNSRAGALTPRLRESMMPILFGSMPHS